MQQIDTSLFLYLNSLHSTFFDTFMWLYTGRFVWVPFYAAIFLMLARAWGWRRALVLAMATGLCVALSDQICATLLRPLFCRPRPSNLAESPIGHLVVTVNGYRGGRWGFPSCHGANSFALAIATIMIVRKWRYAAMILLWASVNCYTRVYLGVHYPGDLATGALVGSLVALAVMIPVLRRVNLSRGSVNSYYSRPDMRPIDFYSGVTCSAPSGLYPAENGATEWWRSVR